MNRSDLDSKIIAMYRAEAKEINSSVQIIEVAPGVRMHLRGADETWAAIQRDRFGPVKCISYDTTIFCIEDADFVLCPECKVVSPFNDINDNTTVTIQYEMQCSSSNHNYMPGGGGVGLGFTLEQLATWQEELVRNPPKFHKY
jgi:hypothetical protein